MVNSRHFVEPSPKQKPDFYRLLSLLCLCLKETFGDCCGWFYCQPLHLSFYYIPNYKLTNSNVNWPKRNIHISKDNGSFTFCVDLTGLEYIRVTRGCVMRSEHLDSSPVFCGVRVLMCCVFCVCFRTQCCLCL